MQVTSLVESICHRSVGETSEESDDACPNNHNQALKSKVAIIMLQFIVMFHLLQTNNSKINFSAITSEKPSGKPFMLSQIDTLRCQ